MECNRQVSVSKGGKAQRLERRRVGSCDAAEEAKCKEIWLERRSFSACVELQSGSPVGVIETERRRRVGTWVRRNSATGMAERWSVRPTPTQPAKKKYPHRPPHLLSLLLSYISPFFLLPSPLLTLTLHSSTLRPASHKRF